MLFLLRFQAFPLQYVHNSQLSIWNKLTADTYIYIYIYGETISTVFSQTNRQEQHGTTVTVQLENPHWHNLKQPQEHIFIVRRSHAIPIQGQECSRSHTDLSGAQPTESATTLLLYHSITTLKTAKCEAVTLLLYFFKRPRYVTTQEALSRE